MAKFSYEEMKNMLDKWVEANRVAGECGEGWGKMADFYTEDALYSWNYGPNDEFAARGREQIRDWAFGTEMEGLDGWRYPYIRTLIDPEKGEIVVFWRQQAPVVNPQTGEKYEIMGTGGSWFRYAGNDQWSWQRDWFDLGNATDCFFKMIEKEHLSETMVKRIERQAAGEPQPGWVKLADFNWLETIESPEDM